MRQLNHRTVNDLYDRCIHISRYREFTIEIDAPWNHHEEFLETMINRESRSIALLLLRLPLKMMRSHGTGDIWINAIHSDDGTNWCGGFRPVQKLLSMGMALGLVQHSDKPSHPSLLPDEMPCMVVEDEKIYRRFRIERSGNQNKNSLKNNNKNDAHLVYM